MSDSSWNAFVRFYYYLTNIQIIFGENNFGWIFKQKKMKRKEFPSKMKVFESNDSE